MFTAGGLVLFSAGGRPKAAATTFDPGGNAAGRCERGPLTRILGAGGGFLIVPALVMLAGLPIYQAAGTSPIISAANSAAGLPGCLNQDLFDLTLMVIFVSAGLAGTFVGQPPPAGLYRLGDRPGSVSPRVQFTEIDAFATDTKSAATSRGWL